MADRRALAPLIPSGPLVLTLDVGTSSVRTLLFDERRGALRGSETRLEYSPRVAADGTAEVSWRLLDQLVARAITGAVAAARSRPIAAVAISTFWHGLIGVDARGRPTTQVILWSDTRSREQAFALRERLDGAAVRLRTGCPLHPSYWPAKLAWLRESQPDVWSRTARWMSYADLLFLRLFGDVVTSPSMASGTGLRRLDGRGWDEELLELLGVEPGQLPEETTGMRDLRWPARGRWPVLRQTPWLCAVGDGALANLGSGCVDPSQRALTVGTSGALRVLTDRLPASLAEGLWCYLLEQGQYVVGGSLSNGGNLYAWLLRTLRVDEDGLEARIRRMPPAGTGLTFLPLLAGERSPGFHPRATGAIAGLTQATTPDDLVHAGLEAVALTFAGVDEALDATVPGARRLVASGAALVRSRAWVQMMADAIGKPVTVSRSAMEASSLGAAELALRRLGVARPAAAEAGRTVEVEPRDHAHAAYAQARRRQGLLYATLIEGST